MRMFWIQLGPLRDFPCCGHAESPAPPPNSTSTPSAANSTKIAPSSGTFHQYRPGGLDGGGASLFPSLSFGLAITCWTVLTLVTRGLEVTRPWLRFRGFGELQAAPGLAGPSARPFLFEFPGKTAGTFSLWIVCLPLACHEYAGWAILAVQALTSRSGKPITYLLSMWFPPIVFFKSHLRHKLFPL